AAGCDCGKCELPFEGRFERRELDISRQLKDGVTAQLRITKEFVRCEASARSEGNAGASGDAIGRDRQAAGEAIGDCVAVAALRELRLNRDSLAVEPVCLLQIQEAVEYLGGGGQRGVDGCAAGDDPG